MRLTKLELQGFKSFARKTELVFDQGITAVIGPNGSGKSNIADAVRWVLGEQSAKALRGSRMEDVIFSGTQERKAQAYCEVTLTFDNSDGTLPLDFAEVSVTRCVYRSGESEYAINRNACRLKDIHELFRDTGIGKEGYSIIGQGRVEEILANKSDDRRIALEEAAGVMRYRVRKEEAVRKLEHTRKNLERLEDILQELDAQREPLAEQAEKARVYLQLRDELKDLELNVFLYQYERVKDKLESASAAVAQLVQEDEELAQAGSMQNANCAAQEEELLAIEKGISELQNRLLNEMSGMEAHAGEVGVLRERRENLQKERARLQEGITREKQKLISMEQELENLHGSGANGQEQLLVLETDISELEAEAVRLQQAITQQEETLDAQKNSIIESLNRLSDARSQLSRMEAMTTALTDRLNAVELEQQSFMRERETLLLEQQHAKAEHEKQTAAYHTIEAARNTARVNVLQAQQALQQSEGEQRALEQQLHAMRSRFGVLEEMARAHEGFYASVRNVLKDCDRDNTLRRAVLGVVAELVRVPQQYEIALEMALGSALQNIVTPTPEQGKLVIDHLRKNNYGRATMLPVSAMKPRLLNAEERASLSMQGCIGVAAELVGFDQAYKSVVENLLGRTVIVESLEAGIALNRRAGAAYRIATLQGDIIHPGGSMTGGSVQKREFSLLGREREIQQLKHDMAQAETKLKEQAGAIPAARQAIATAEENHRQQEARLHAQDIDHARYTEKLELIERDIGVNEKKQEQMQLEGAQIQDNLADIARERAQAEHVQSGIEEGGAATREDVALSQQKLTALREQGEALSAQLTEHKMQRVARQKEEAAMVNEQKRLERETTLCARTIQDAQNGEQQNCAQEEQLNEQIAKLTFCISSEQNKVDTHKEEQQALEEERLRRVNALREVRERKDDINAQLRMLDERKHRQELAYSRAELEFSAMQQRILEDYELTYEQALAFRRQPFGVTAAHVRVDELRKAIRELGNINVNAVEDYQMLSERCDHLHAQCDDLNKAEMDLNTLIAELAATMEKQFLRQFETIQKNFTAVFTQLFDGGYAELRLSNPKDPLNCEIDIIAQPPGKKLQLLTLLSGGERALTAIALLFALLRLKPTVFCILDEIETSLDEVNVARFAHYLQHYSDDTQFILITHRKGSMEVCNALYGVAMEEKGVSRLVSARFQEHAS